MGEQEEEIAGLEEVVGRRRGVLRGVAGREVRRAFDGDRGEGGEGEEDVEMEMEIEEGD